MVQRPLLDYVICKVMSDVALLLPRPDVLYVKHCKEATDPFWFIGAQALPGTTCVPKGINEIGFPVTCKIFSWLLPCDRLLYCFYLIKRL